jgi:quercetin dioxygenase-like cupin family protein
MTIKLLLTTIIPLLVLLSPAAHSQVTEPEAAVINFDEVEPINVGDAVSIRVISASTVGMTRINMKKGGKGPHHNHPDEGLIMVSEGQLRATSRGRTWTMNPGDVFVLPAWVPHQVEALVDSIFFEAFGPGSMFFDGFVPGEE